MFKNRSQSIKNYGYDNETDVDYRFNLLGYRSDFEFDNDPSAIVLLGNSITFGIGLPVELTFGGLIAQKLNKPVYNFALGCYPYTNNEQIKILRNILETFTPCAIVFQINNLNRTRTNGEIVFNNSTDIVLKEYENFYKDVTILLSSTPHIFLYWDEQDFDIQLPECLIYNKYHIDNSLKSNLTTFGPKSHKLIAEKIIKKLNE